jgi:TPR repeat protein
MGILSISSSFAHHITSRRSSIRLHKHPSYMDYYTTTIDDIRKQYHLELPEAIYEPYFLLLRAFYSQPIVPSDDDKVIDLTKTDENAIAIVKAHGYDINIPIVQTICGMYYRNIEQNSELMTKYYSLAVEQKCIEAMKMLSFYYHDNKNYFMMKKYYLMAIDHGDATCMCLLGNYCRDVEKDYELMKKYYLMAIECNFVDAMYNLAEHFEDKEEYELMKKYYLMAIEQGDTESMRKLAYHFLEREKNLETVKMYYLMAIERKDVNAMVELGDIYQFEEPNPELMIIYYKMAVDSHNDFAMLRLGTYYAEIKNYEMMKQYYLMAIECDKSAEMNRLGATLGHYYENVEEDYEMMEKYYLMAIEQNEKHAMVRLGDYYFHNGEYELMKRYYQMAIQHGDTRAMISLGDYYFQIEDDYQSMMTYYSKAADEYQDLKAMNRIVDYHKNHETDSGDEMIIKYYCMSIDLNDVYAMYGLGCFYKSKDEYNSMKHYLFMAIEHGSEEALEQFAQYWEENPLMEYRELQEVEDDKRSSILINRLENLEREHPYINGFYRKIELFTRFKNFKQCAICRKEEVLNINLDCGHEVCISCFNPEMSCTQCGEETIVPCKRRRIEV